MPFFTYIYTDRPARILFFRIIEVNVKLREGNGYAVRVETLFHVLLHLEINAPVIAAFHPNARYDVYRTRAVRLDSYQRGRLFQYHFVFGYHVQNGGFRAFEILPVTHGIKQIDAAHAFGRIIRDVAV